MKQLLLAKAKAYTIYIAPDYMDYNSFSDPRRVEGWVGLVGRPIRIR